MDKSTVAMDRVSLSSLRYFFTGLEIFMVLPQFDIKQILLSNKDLKQDMGIATGEMYSRAVLLLEM